MNKATELRRWAKQRNFRVKIRTISFSDLARSSRQFACLLGEYELNTWTEFKNEADRLGFVPTEYL